MPNRTYLLSPKEFDLGIVTGSTVIGGSSISNIQNSRPSYRATFSITTPFIEIDALTSVTWDTLGLGFIKSLSAADTFRLRAKNSYPVTTSPLRDVTATIWPTGSSLTRYSKVHRHYEFTSTTARYWRIDLSCSVAPEVGRVMLGRRLDLGEGTVHLNPSLSEPGTESRDLGGERSRRLMGGPVRSIPVEWPHLTKAQALKDFYEFMLERGENKDFMFVENLEELVIPMPSVYVGVGRDVNINLLPGFVDQYKVSMMIEELGSLVTT